MEAFLDIAYVDGARSSQKLDLYLPDRGKRLPLIAWIHGGGFMAGSKKDNVPLPYLESGFAVASLNYRLSQEAPFPAQIQDVKSALRWLRAHAKPYRLDPGRFAAWGESAGGYLSALLAATGDMEAFDVGEHLDFPSRVQAVVDYFGPTDFLLMDEQRLPGGMAHDPPDSPESRLLGGAIQEHPDLAAKANPMRYLTRKAPPFLIVHGDRDPLVPFRQSLMLKEALDALGVPATFHVVRGGGHGRFQDRRIADLTLEFLERQLKPRSGDEVPGAS